MPHPFNKTIVTTITDIMRRDRALDALDRAADMAWEARQLMDDANRTAKALGLTKTDHWSIR